MKRLIALGLIVLGVTTLAFGGVARMVTSGGFTLESGETLRGTLVVTSGEIVIEEDARLTGGIIMTSGSLHVLGEVDRGIFMTSGDITIGPEGIVHGGIVGTSDSIEQADGGQVAGNVYSTSTWDDDSILARFFVKGYVLPVLLIGTGIFITLRSRRQQLVTGSRKEDSNVAQILRELNALQEDGLVSEAEYEAKNAEILSTL